MTLLIKSKSRTTFSILTNMHMWYLGILSGSDAGQTHHYYHLLLIPYLEQKLEFTTCEDGMKEHN